MKFLFVLILSLNFGCLAAQLNFRATQLDSPNDSLPKKFSSSDTLGLAALLDPNIEEFTNVIETEWPEKLYLADGNYESVVDTVVKNFTRLSRKFIQNTVSNEQQSENYYTKYIRAQNRLFNRAVKELEKKYQQYVLKIPFDIQGFESQSKEDEKITKQRNEGVNQLERKNINLTYYIYKSYSIKRLKWLPSKSDIFAKYYNKELSSGALNLLNNSTLIFGSDLSAFTSNIISGYAGIPVRFSLSTVIAKGRTTEVNNSDLVGKTPEQIQTVINDVYKENLKNNTLANILNGGGFLGFKAEFPLLNYNQSSRKFKPQFELSTNAALSGEFASGGGSLPSTEANFFHYLGFDLKFVLPFTDITETFERTQTFAGFLTLSQKTINGTETFFKNLSSPDIQPFSQFEGSFGIIANGIKISYTYLYFTKPTLNDVYTSRFGLTYVPSFFN